jgi:predicted transcriptional regulator
MRESIDITDQIAEPKEVGQELQTALDRVLRDIDGCSMRPTDIARTLDVSRVMVSRLLSAIRKPDPVETLARIPGPETLRSIVRAAAESGVDAASAKDALALIDQFDLLIREKYGTRAALNAALSDTNHHTRKKFEQSSRYQVFKGMSQIVGAQSSLWVTCMMLTPNKENPDGIDITAIHGTSGLRRLRPDSEIRFVYGIPPEYKDRRQSPQRTDTDISSFMVHEPAPLQVEEENGQIINIFSPELGGKDALYDMFSEVYIPNGSNRYASNGRSMRGTTVIPDVPVVTLVSDVILCDDIFEKIKPQLFIYNTMPRGGADIEDPKRDVDRINTNDSIVHLDRSLESLEISEMPKYVDMVRYLCEKNRCPMDSIRVHRLRVQYPVYGFQYTIGFKVPEKSS